MTVRLDGEVVRLEGECRLEEAEALVTLISGRPDRAVDVSACRLMHSAVFQVLLGLAPVVNGEPDDAFLREFVAPNWRRAIEGGTDARDYLEREI